MKFAFFTIPMHGHHEQVDELNRFLAGHKIEAIEKTFIANGNESAWNFCISYEQSGENSALPKRGKVDYREVLSDPEFQVYAKLRALRKTLATQEGVPPYALFNNQQLASMVQNRVDNLTGMREIDGIGESKIEKYGQAFLQLLVEGIPDLIKVKANDNET